MKIIVFGATGKVGSKVVTKLLDKEYEVRAFVRSSSKINKRKGLEIIRGDVHSSEDVWKAIKDCDAVISCLSSWHTKSKDVQVSAMQNIIPAMKIHGTKRIVSITGSGVFDSADKPTWLEKLNRRLILLGANKVFRDGENHIALLRKSKLEWIVLRSPIMTEAGRSGNFVLDTNFPKPWDRVIRDDVATAMVELVETKNWVHSAPFIHNLPAADKES